MGCSGAAVAAQPPASGGNVVNSKAKFPLKFWEVMVACGVVLGFLLGLGGVYFTMPASDYSFLKLPRTLQDIQILRSTGLAKVKRLRLNKRILINKIESLQH